MLGYYGKMNVIFILYMVYNRCLNKKIQLKWSNTMQYNVKWIINGNITINADSKEKAEQNIKKTLENIINKNKNDFENIGATAIQGSANKINNE